MSQVNPPIVVDAGGEALMLLSLFEGALSTPPVLNGLHRKVITFV